jgi:signal transduction histidine kinase
MRERSELLGGELDVRPTPGGGFEVMARLPLAPTGTAQI